jgi:membrane protease YdiL (CAAX protease family)
MVGTNSNIRLTGAIFSSLGLMLFAFFIHFPFPARWLAFTVLAAVTFFISRSLKSTADLEIITGQSRGGRNMVFWLLTGAMYGVFLALFYRWYLETEFLPQSFHWFALVAAGIGITEELVFRGYVQGALIRSTGLFSIVAGTVAHTGYKCCLFLGPASSGTVDIGFLAISTFFAGLLLGILRHFSSSVWPAVIAHALFDILIYGENVNPPWWVW